jgi:small GTP-binding protein
MTVIARKICLIGDFGVGKTSLIRRFVDRQFSDQYLSTVGVKISKKQLDLEARSLQLLIWDIEGQTKFKSIAPSYFQGAKGAIIVGDVTRRETLEHVAKHSQDFLSVNPKSHIVVALNKADLMDAEEFDALAQHFAPDEQTLTLDWFATSAKTGENVDQIFQRLATHLIE